jgi:hypothetical protein
MNPKSFTNHLFANPQKLPFNGTQIQSNHRYPQTPHQGSSSPNRIPISNHSSSVDYTQAIPNGDIFISALRLTADPAQKETSRILSQP